MVKLAKFPTKKKSNKLKKKKLTTWDRRMLDLKKLDGKYNGWWIYQFCMGEFAYQINKRKRRY